MTRPCEHCPRETEEYALRIVHVGKPSSAHAVCDRCWHSLSSRANYAARPVEGKLSHFFAVQEIPLHAKGEKT